MRGSLSKLTSISLIVGLVLANVLLPVRSVSAAWTYEQLFNALSLGDLNGQDSWAKTSGLCSVQATRVYEGAQAMKYTDPASGSGCDYRRTITAISDGSYYFAFNSSSTAALNPEVQLRDNGGAGTIMSLELPGFLSSSKLRIRNGAGVVKAEVTSTYSNDTWYPVNLEFDDASQPDKARARAYVTGAWTSFTPWVPISAYTSVNQIRFSFGSGDGSGAGTIYLDSISATDITTLVGGGGGTPTPDLLQSVGGGVILFDHLTIL